MVSAEATLIALRESLEAFLIIGILAGLVVKLGRPDARRHLVLGALCALGASILLGALIHRTALGLFTTYEEAFEGVAAAVAVGILTYMVVWMYRHTLGMVATFREKAKAALDAGRPAVLFGLAFVAVFREGLETALFYATLVGDQTVAGLALSALIGIGVSAVASYLIFAGVVRLSLKRFFAATGVMLIVFAGGLLVTSVHEFTEAGWIPETATAWDTEPVLDQHGTVGAFVKAVLGYRERPTVLEAGVYAAYVLGLGAWFLRGVSIAPALPAPTAGRS